MALNREGRLFGYYPLSTPPSDVAVISQNGEFAVSTTTGAFQIYNGQGEQTFQYNADPLSDIDVLDDGTTFLMTSRYAGMIFTLNRDTQRRHDWPHPFTAPVDADRLPNGHFLVCDAQEERVGEINPQGEVVWEYRNGLKQPMDALRLENGNTLISDFDNHRIIEDSPQGSVVNIYQGFDHPQKLTLLPTGEILVADSDKRRLAVITTTGNVLTVRKNMNYVKSAAWVLNEDFFLATIEARYPPPHPPSAQSQQEQTGGIGSTQFNHFMLLVIGFGLRYLTTRFQNRLPAAHVWLIAAYGIIFGIAYFHQTLAAASPPHQPGVLFWLAAAVLAIFAFRDCLAGLRSRDDWHEHYGGFFCPVRTWHIGFLLLWPLVPLILHYWHINHEISGWYWPMLAWGVGLYWFFKWLIQADDPRPLLGHTFWQKLPFTAGSVGGYEDDSNQSFFADSLHDHAFTNYHANRLVAGFMVLAALLYIIQATEIPTDFHGDEAEVAMHGIELIDQGDFNIFTLGWYNIPNLFYLIPGGVMWLFGETIFGIRMAGALTGLAAIPIFYLLARRIMLLAPAVMATLLFATSAYYLHFSRIGIGYNQTTFFTLLVLYAWIRAVQEREARWLCLAGFAAGMALMSYQAGKLLIPLTLVSFVLLVLIRLLSWRQCALAIALFLLGAWTAAGPLLGNDIYIPGSGLSRAGSISLFSNQGRELIQNEFPGEQNFSAMLQGQLERSVLAPITYHDRSPYLNNFTYGGMMDPIPAVLLSAGVLILALNLSHPFALIVLVWMAVTLLTGSALTNRAPSYQRLVGLYPLLILAAVPVLYAVIEHISRLARWRPLTRAALTALVLAVLIVMSYHRYFHQIQSVPQHLDEWTRIARFLKDAGPSHYTYFFGPPYVWFEYGTIQFLAPHARGENVEDPEGFLQYRVNRRGPVVFLLVRGNRQYLPQLRERYPDGIEEHWYNRAGGNPFTTYTVYF